MRNIFIVGASHTGKTPLGDMLAKRFGLTRVSASDWVRKRFDGSAYPDRREFTDAITRFSCAELAKDPNVCVNHVRRTIDLTRGGYIIEGVRNPRDFAILFDPSRDVIVTVHYPTSPLAQTEFERDGVRLIGEQVHWLVGMSIMDEARNLAFTVSSLDGGRISCNDSPEFDIVVPDTVPTPNLTTLFDHIAWIPAIMDSMKPDLATTERPNRVHAEIAPLKAWLREDVLYDMDPAYKERYVQCCIFAVSAYEGEAPTFQVLLENGALFSYVPPHILLLRDPAKIASDEPSLPLHELVYHDCPSEDIVVKRYAELAAHPTRAWFRASERWMDAIYLWTIDWYLGNELLHALRLENGQIALLPSHKIVFNDQVTAMLPPYKKLHQVWKID